MRVFPCMILLICLCTAGTGCSLFKKNTNDPGASTNTGGKAPAKFPDPLLNSNNAAPPPPPAFPATSTSATKDSSILAGTVIDAYHRPIGNAYIRWVNLDEKDAGAPIDIATDSGGHFIIQGVKPGASYKIMARTKQGDKMLAGTVLTSAPNVRVLIPIREDLVDAKTPPLPGAPVSQGALQKEVEPNSFGTAWPNPTTTPVLKAPAPETPNLPATLNLPSTTSTPVANPAPAAGMPTYVPGVAENPNPTRLPMLSIPNSPPPLPYDPPRPPALTPGDAKLDTGPTRVPSCVLVGERLANMALKDSRGQTWEYKKQGKGKLVLIDFWGTNCVYCRDSMPALNRLQTQYGSRGLEVIGIALEPGADERRDADAVNKMATSLQVSYRQLMGHAGSFDVGKSFAIKGVPTLILLNEQGDIIWRHVGRPDPALLNALERTIQSTLNSRPF